MIDFRYHLVSIIAVFLALTVGLVLGTTMLQDPLLDTLQSETADLRGQTEELRSERDVADKVNAGADEMAEALSEDVLADLLTGLGVAVVAAPGADQEMADALAERAEEAGGEVVGRVHIAGAFLEGDNATFVDELSLQISHEPGDLTGGPYEKAGTEIGRALAVPEEDGSGDGGGAAEEGTGTDGPSDGPSDGEPDGEDRDGESGYGPEAVLETFSEGGLITVEGEPAGETDAVIVVAPAAGSSDGDDLEASNAVLGTITAALHEEVGAAVVAGDGPSGRGRGMLAQARAQEPAFATVDTAGRPMGEIISILALAENLEGAGGAYGIGERVHGFLPDPLPDRIDPSDEEEDGPAEDGADGRETGGADGARRTTRDGE